MLSHTAPALNTHSTKLPHRYVHGLHGGAAAAAVVAAVEDSHKKSFTSFQGCNISTATHLCYHFGKGFQSNYVRYVFFLSLKTENFKETVEKLLKMFSTLTISNFQD